MGTNAELESDIWYWYHNIFKLYCHIQLTIKYRKSLLKVKRSIMAKEIFVEIPETKKCGDCNYRLMGTILPQ